jgi:hypothetical protein
MTNSTEGVNFKVLTMGKSEIDRRQPSNLNVMNLKKVQSWIDAKPISDELKDELKKMASTWPDQALDFWVKSYSRHLENAQRNLTNKPKPVVELGDEPYVSRNEVNQVPKNDEFDL